MCTVPGSRSLRVPPYTSTRRADSRLLPPMCCARLQEFMLGLAKLIQANLSDKMQMVRATGLLYIDTQWACPCARALQKR